MSKREVSRRKHDMTVPVDKKDTPRMFSTIARRYDLLNHLLSMNVDRRWRATLVRMARVAPGERVLDAATGTGDVAVAVAQGTPAGAVVGVDLSTGMLAVGHEKLRTSKNCERVGLVEGDALRLPFADESFDVVTIAFGLRNLPDYRAGVAEMARVLRPGGRLLVLEFFPPEGGVLLAGYRFYLGRILPAAGRIVSGSREAYRYLAASIEDFITHEDMKGYLRGAGLHDIERKRLTAGIATIYGGTKAAKVSPTV